ncbi:vWA-like protein [Glarea lozoyensis ATCC 20868]|nr:vWA-like protein [Glarea lozoyensis ATCC 20868]EPE27167.1 vWA-like protein [Glarea lozoyensis ATCC 20868]
MSDSLAPPGRSFFGSIRKLGRKNSNSSTKSTHSNNSDTSTRSAGPRNPFSGSAGRRTPSPNPNPFSNASPATRRPDRPGMNAFTVPSNEPPPAYTPSPTAKSGQTVAFELPSPSHAAPPPIASSSAPGGDDPYSFLGTFDTVLLIDDSGSMAGRSWREVSQALSTIAPIITRYDQDGIDVYFLNHKSTDAGNLAEGIAPSGYRGITRAETVTGIFERVRPTGSTPTGTRVQHILKPYLAKCDKELKAGRDVKPLNLIVLTDGVPSDDLESILLKAAQKLDNYDAPPSQVGVQFFQVGNENGAREALEELDDQLSERVQGGVRDIVDTVTWTGGVAASEGGIGLTGDAILKVVLGSVIKRLDRKRASGDVSRPRRS